MTYFPDFSLYRYIGDSETSLNIGWLDQSMPYPQGETSEEFRQKLLQFCISAPRIHQTRGWHQCNLGNCPYPVKIDENGFGDAEIRVIGQSKTYASPDLIIHYVIAHKYKPPDEFVEAVLKSPPPDAKPYQELRIQLDPPFIPKPRKKKWCPF
jgi:hypothetical protein